MILSVVDAQDLYMSAKAYTAITIAELEAKWYEPAVEKYAKVMAALAKGQQPNVPLPEQMSEQPEVYGGNYAAEQQNIL